MKKPTKYTFTPPRKFLANNGKEFSVKIVKVNIRSVKLLLVEANKTIKVNKKSRKLIY